MIFHVHGDDRAYVTRKTLKLNRTPLMERRAERLENVETLLNVWMAKFENDPLKSVVENELHKEYEKDKEFSFIVKCHLASRKFPIRYQVDG